MEKKEEEEKNAHFTNSQWLFFFFLDQLNKATCAQAYHELSADLTVTSAEMQQSSW